MQRNLEQTLELIKGLHFDGFKNGGPGYCVLGSLAVRDALRLLGFDAQVKSVACEIKAAAGEPSIGLHALCVGMNKLIGDPYHGKDWDGHLIVTVPGYIIDPSMSSMRRDAWDWVPPTAVVRRQPKIVHTLPTLHGKLPVIARWREDLPDRDNYKFEAVWASYNANQGWRNGPDYRDVSRRRALARDIVDEIEKLSE